MTLLSRAARRIWKLPPATTPVVDHHRDLPVPMRDGVVLLADRYAPRWPGPVPTLLVRSCYGRRGLMGFQYGQLFAERGFQVVIQSIRGAYGSGGALDPLIHEADDGQDTVSWLCRQPWFSPPLGMVGASYLGYAQWAVGMEPPTELAAMSIQMGPRDPVRTIYPGGAFALENWLTWAEDITGRPWANSVLWASIEGYLAGRRAVRRLVPAFTDVPVGEGYRRALGHRVPFLEDWMRHPGDGPYWQARSVADAAHRVRVPVGLLSGWYDAFLADTLDAYRVLHQRGQQVRLTVGPWGHSGLGDDWPAMFRDGFSWLRAHLAGDQSQLGPAPVRVFVLGHGGHWRDLESWPPPGVASCRWYLHPGRTLGRDQPPDSPADRFRYDPADPTPSLGGATLGAGDGPRDDRRLESRADVLTYTSPPLTENLVVAGAVTAEVHYQPGLAYADVFVRLCDVAPDGSSTNVCDGLRRLSGPPAAGEQPVRCVAVDMAATAYLLPRGHRLRVHVSGGAHPRFARNHGTGDPLGTATRMVAGVHAVHHTPACPSAVILPVLSRLPGTPVPA